MRDRIHLGRVLCSLLPTISRLGGGVSVSARLQCQALFDKIPLSVEATRDAESERDRGEWPDVAIGLHRSFGPKSYGFAPSLFFALLRQRPDLVHVHGVWQFHCAAVYLWSLLTGRPYVVTPHGMLEPWIRARSRHLKAAVSFLYQDRFLRRAAGFQLLTDKERSDVADYLTTQPAPVIPNYVDLEETDIEKPAWWRSDFDGRTVYLFLGRIHEKKGCRELCDAWEANCRQDPGFAARSALVFCGWNDGLDGFEARVEEIAARFSNIVFVGGQYGAEKRRSFAAASFFILPSKSEGLPMAILEAWGAGIPVLMTSACNLDTGFAAGAAHEIGQDVEAIRAGLRAADGLGSEARAAMGLAGQALIEARYSKSSVRDGLIALYESAIKNGPNR